MARRVGPDRISRWRTGSGSACSTSCRCPGSPRAHARRRLEEGEPRRAGRPATASTTASARGSRWPRRCSSRSTSRASPRHRAEAAADPQGRRRRVPVAAAGRSPSRPAAPAVVRDGMYAVSNEGTAYRSRIADPAMLMAGKTGTSQVRIITAAERAAGVTKNEQLPWNRRDHALFVCYALRSAEATRSPRSSSTAAAARRWPRRSPATSCSTRSMRRAAAARGLSGRAAPGDRGAARPRGEQPAAAAVPARDRA